MEFQGSIYNAWLGILSEVYRNGEIITDERDSTVKEIRNLTTTIQDPLRDYYNLKKLNGNLSYQDYIEKYTGNHNIWKEERLVKYCKQFIDPNNDSGFIYTYGNRLNGHFGDGTINQVFNSIESRLADNKESRRALAITWDPKIDINSDEVPCLQYIQMMIRNHKLEITALWRSHDIYGAWYPNIIGLSYLSEKVAKLFDIEISKITIYSVNAHYYLTDEDSVKNELKP